jgi:hypothetical protein
VSKRYESDVYDEPENDEASLPPGWWIGFVTYALALMTIAFFVGRWSA